MRKIASIGFVLTLAGALGALLSAQAPGAPADGQPDGKGVISGTATSTVGGGVGDVTIRAVAPDGQVVALTQSESDGDFVLAPLLFGAYTIQCLDKSGRVLGTSKIELGAPTAAVKVTCGGILGAYIPRRRPRAILAAVGAAVAAAGTAAIIAARGDASGSR